MSILSHRITSYNVCYTKLLRILAILAAAAIPTMLGFVEDAKGKAEVANARACYVAAQTIATEESASGTNDAGCVTAITDAKLKTLTGITDTFTISGVTVSNGKVTALTYNGATHNVEIIPGSPAKVTKKTVTTTTTTT